MSSEFASGKDFTSSGGNFTAKGEVLSEFRSLQADTRKLFKKHTPPITYIPLDDRRP